MDTVVRPLRVACRSLLLAAGAAICVAMVGGPLQAAPALVDPALGVRTAASGLALPTGIAFLASNDWLVIEKNTGRVQRVRNGVVSATVLDIAVNNANDRGLLGIALHPQFATNHWVYLFWSCRVAPPPSSNPYFPTARTCGTTPALGADTGNVLSVPLLGNRVDRFVWNGSSLIFDRNIITLRAFQYDAAPTPPNQGDASQAVLGIHIGGVLRFGRDDGKLYVQVGDLGRRGQLQNLPSGPTATGLGTTVPDDQFGGPAPDDAHFSGVVLRLNADGTAPTDNPFYSVGAQRGGEVGRNLQKIFVYGVRNGFGLAVDPYSGNVWDSENGEDSFDELNRLSRGSNLGWIQIMGPSSRYAQYRQIESTTSSQQLRWPMTRLASSLSGAQARLFVLPGSQYSEPEFSWKYPLAPTAVGFLKSTALGTRYQGDLFVGFSGGPPLGGPLFDFNLSGDRTAIAPSATYLSDQVMDNTSRDDMTEGQPLLFGTGFGVVTDIRTAPNGNLLVVSLTDGRIYEIYRR
jgi:glucose/arabinose dehydrogenase